MVPFLRNGKLLSLYLFPIIKIKIKKKEG